VGRTLSDSQGARKIAHGKFRRARRPSGDLVQAVAKEIQTKGFSTTPGRAKGPCLPTSFASKIGFFLHPNIIAPLDRFSLKGLHEAKKIQSGLTRGYGRVDSRNYPAFLDSFNAIYDVTSTEIGRQCDMPWFMSFCRYAGVEPSITASPGFRRKILDSYLMRLGGYR
jgi:hypothetical protein